MYPHKEKIQELLNNFSKSAELGVLCFDTGLNVVAFSPSKNIVNEFICLEMNQITTFLAEKFSDTPLDQKIIHTFFLDANLVCNVCLLMRDGSYTGAFVTQPVFVRKLEQNEFDAMLDRLSPSMKDRGAMWKVLLSVPVIPYDRFLSIGNIMNILSQQNLSERSIRQVIRYHDGSAGTDKPKIVIGAEREDPSESAWYHEYTVYQQIKESIRNGDAKGIQEFIDEIRAGSILVNRLNPSDFLPALKQTFVKVCAMGCYMAIDAGAPYKKMMDLSDEMIRQADKLDNPNAAYSLLRTAMLAFARAVSLSSYTGYSKPVRQVMEYISEHYSEKITLDKLSQYTGLSTYYLSNLIKKETGLILMDHINRVRVEQGRKLLRDTDMSILDVAQEVGFQYQNHFASVFRRQTGFSPTEYRSITGSQQSLRKGDNPANTAMPIILEQTYNKLSIFEGLYDMARIVDPVGKMSWIINSENEIQSEPTLCHNYWHQNESCRDCIAVTAFSKNDTVVKIKEKDGDIFLIFATPRTIGEKTFVIEIIRKFTNRIFFDKKEQKPSNLYSQKQLLEKLAMHMKRNKAAGKHLTIMLAVLEAPELTDVLRDEYLKVINRSLRNDADWAGSYLGNVFLIAIDDADETAANQIKRIIDINYRIALEKMNMSGEVKVHCSLKALPFDLSDPSAFIRLAFMALNDEVTVA